MYPGTLRPKSEGSGQGHIAQTQCSLGLVLVVGARHRFVFLRLSLCVSFFSSFPVLRPLKLPTAKDSFDSPRLDLSSNTTYEAFRNLVFPSPIFLLIQYIESPIGTPAPASPCCLQTPTVCQRVPFSLDQSHTSKHVLSS